MKSKKCLVVDYGIGNVYSVTQALTNMGATVTLSGDKEEIKNADRVILPGVGAFGKAVKVLQELGFDDVVKEFILTERPFLGICVGMQVLMDEGHEFGVHPGLGLFSGAVKKISLQNEAGDKVRVPLIGWNTVFEYKEGRWVGSVLDSEEAQSDYYFVHSFQVCPENTDDILATVKVGTGRVVAAIQKDNVTGVQFHPERSARAGQAFLKNFLSM